MAAQPKRRPGSPDIEKLEADPELGLAGIPAKSLPKKEEPPKDVKILVGQTGPLHPAVDKFMSEYGAIPRYDLAGKSRRRRTKKKSRKAGRRKTRK